MQTQFFSGCHQLPAEVVPLMLLLLMYILIKFHLFNVWNTSPFYSLLAFLSTRLLSVEKKHILRLCCLTVLHFLHQYYDKRRYPKKHWCVDQATKFCLQFGAQNTITGASKSAYFNLEVRHSQWCHFVRNQYSRF